MTHDAPPVMSSFTPTERAFIDRHRVARLATADLHGAPHVIPIVYASEDDAVYFIVLRRRLSPVCVRLGLSSTPQIAGSVG
jgi:hypothetical protein